MSASAPLIHARGLVKKFGELAAVDGIDFDVQRGEAFGFLGPNGAGKSSTMRMIGCVSPPTAGTLRIRHGSGCRRSADPRPPGCRTAAGHARQRADSAREPHHLRPLLRPVAQRGPRAGRPAARVRAAGRACGKQGGAAVGRHEAPADHRALARERARRAAPRRAHDRARSAGTPRRVGPPLQAQTAGSDARPDDALHGRGGATLRPPRRDGSRQHRRSH